MMDATVVIIAVQWGGYTAEAFLGILAIMDIIIIIALHQPEPESNAPPSPQIPKELTGFAPTPVEETSENLEKTRYQ
jgi:hypothetical protein